MADYANFKITTSTNKIAAMNARINIVTGGTSASKTYSIMAILQSIAETDPNSVTTVVSESIPHLKRGAIRDFLTIMKDVGLYEPDRWNRASLTYTFANESIIEFITVDEDTARGGRRDYLFINECNLISYNTYSELEIRTKKTVYLDYNPVSEFWVDTQLLNKKRDDIEFLRLTYKDNEALDERTIKAIEARKGDGTSNWWRVYGMGLVGSLEGNIYEGWIPVSEPPEGAQLARYGLDFGSVHPTALIAVYELPEHNAIYVEECYYAPLPKISDYIPVLRQHVTDTDIPIICDTARLEIIREMEANGFRAVGANKNAGSVLRGINEVRDLKVYYSGKNLEREYLTYAWRKKRDGTTLEEPIKLNDDAMDALRYAVDDMSKPDVWATADQLL